MSATVATPPPLRRNVNHRIITNDLIEYKATEKLNIENLKFENNLIDQTFESITEKYVKYIRCRSVQGIYFILALDGTYYAPENFIQVTQQPIKELPSLVSGTLKSVNSLDFLGVMLIKSDCIYVSLQDLNGNRSFKYEPVKGSLNNLVRQYEPYIIISVKKLTSAVMNSFHKAAIQIRQNAFTFTSKQITREEDLLSNILEQLFQYRKYRNNLIEELKDKSEEINQESDFAPLNERTDKLITLQESIAQIEKNIQNIHTQISNLIAPVIKSAVLTPKF